MNNYLPPIQKNEDERPRIDAYRQVGMMALLDIDYWEGESEKSIEDYFENIVEHLKDGSVLLGLNDEKRAIGYFTWKTSETNPNVIELKRQSAPFGDHLEMMKKLKRRFPDLTLAHSIHPRSARKEQVAWEA